MGYQPGGNVLSVTPNYVNKVALFVAAPASDGISLDVNYLCQTYSQHEQIAWARQLQQQGTEVLMSLDGYAVHALERCGYSGVRAEL